jgi:hypothetical protein
MVVMAATATERREVKYPARKDCTRCHRKRSIKMFRLLSSGYRQGMCVDCERDYERDRWHSRTATSKATAGGTAHRRRQAVAA